MRLLLAITLGVLLVASCEGAVQQAQAQGNDPEDEVQQPDTPNPHGDPDFSDAVGTPNAGSDTRDDPNAGGADPVISDSQYAAADKIAEKIHKVWQRLGSEAVSLSVELDQEENKSKKSPLVVVVGWWKNGDDLAALAKAQRDFFDKLKELTKLSKEELQHVEVVQQAPSTGEARPDFKFRFLETLVASDQAARAPPAFASAGHKTKQCSAQTDAGTLGGFFIDGFGKHWAVSNTHVYNSQPGKCVGKQQGVYKENTAAFGKDEGFFVKGPAKSWRHLQTTMPQWDVTLGRVKANHPITCKVKAHAGATYSSKGLYTKSWRKKWGKLKKFGQRTMFTRGKIIGHMLQGTGGTPAQWGYIVTGTWPPEPHDPNNRDPANLRCPAAKCTPGQAANRAAGLAKPKPYDLQSVFSAGGDSGSFIYDNNDKAVCMLQGGTWRTRPNGVQYKITWCYPIAMMLQEINAKPNAKMTALLGARRPWSLCSDARGQFNTI